jgi:hypothetical protein
MGGWSFESTDKYAMRQYAARQHSEQKGDAFVAAESNDPVPPPNNINPLRWKAMVKSMKNAIADGHLDQI